MSTEQYTVTKVCDVCGQPVATASVGNFIVATRHAACGPAYRDKQDATDRATLNAERMRQASPALLAALKAVIEARYYDGPNCQESFRAAWEQARAAIAPAEGAPAE